MSPDQPELLHQMNPTGRFTDRVVDYVKFRPSYPGAIVDAILEGLGEPRGIRVADVGAGTGISSRMLAERGVRVVAIEPNEAMRAGATAHPLVMYHSGTAEATGMENGEMDLVLCAQAFHWTRQDKALGEFARILKDRGRIAIAWNSRDRTNALMTGYRNAIRAVGGEHPAESREFDPGVIDRSGLFENLRLVEVPNVQRLDEQGLIGRVMSASYAPKEGARAEELVARLRGLFKEFEEQDGLVTLKYITQAWLAEKRALRS